MEFGEFFARKGSGAFEFSDIFVNGKRVGSEWPLVKLSITAGSSFPITAAV